MKWKVEHRFLHGWDDAGWTFEGKPMIFGSKVEADMEIDDFFKDIDEAVKNGDMEGTYRKEDFRAIPVEDVTT